MVITMAVRDIKGRWGMEARQRQSLRYSGAGNPMYGRHHSDETRQLIGNASRRLEVTAKKLNRLYWEDEKSTAEIGKIYGVNADTVRRRMIEFDIPRRPPSQGNAGKKFTEEHKRRISEAHKGKTASDEARQNMSKATKRRWEDPEYRDKCLKILASRDYSGEKNPFYGKKHSEESLRNMSLGHVDVSGDKNPMFGRHHTEKAKEKIREARLKQIIPAKDTSIEIAVQNELRRIGVPFEKHVPLLNKYQVDLLLEDKLIIECDGDYWHSRSGVKQKDRKRDIELEEAGYTIFRLKEHQINSNVTTCVNAVLGRVESFGVG